MKPSWLISTAAFLISTALSIETSPFYPPQEAETNKRAFHVLQLLNKRVANNCPSGYNPCSVLKNSNVCCKVDSRCARDEADNIACCPTGASCTGSLVAATAATSTASGSGSDTSSFMFPQYTSASETTGSEGPTITGSTMPGAYPFIYVPTTFSNAATCSAYYSRCQSDYSQCTGQLGNGGQYGVTVAGGNAGVTVQGGAAATPAASACSSLRLEACHGINVGYCGSYSTKESSENGASAPGRTSLQDLVFGMAVGVAGMLI